MDEKATLARYLQLSREAVLWKLDGLSEYDARRPMTPTGTNILGLVKHLASVEFGYFGDTFDRPHGESMPWFENGAEPNADLYATSDQTREQIVAFYRRAWVHSDATINTLSLDAVGHVPWWPAELIDGAIGQRPASDGLPEVDADWWPTYVADLERIAREA